MIRLALFCGLALLQGMAIQAVVVPAELPAGLYSIPFDSNGTASSDPVLLHAVDAGSDRAYSGRQNPPSLPASQAKCGTGGNINFNDFNTAKSNIQKECDRGETIAKRTALVFTTGKAVAYFCNYDATNRCWRQEYQEAMNKIGISCGAGKGGEIYVASYSKSYGGDNVGQQICRF